MVQCKLHDSLVPHYGTVNACTSIRSQGQKKIQSSLTYFAVGGTDIDIRLLVNMRKFIEEECMVRLCYVEQGGCIDTQTFSRGCEGQF